MFKVIFIFLITSISAFATPTGFLKVVPGKITGFSSFPDQVKRIKRSYTVIEAVINSEEFKDRVITYRGTSGYSSNHSMSNAQIYELLMTGKEILGGENNLGEMNFETKRYMSRNPFSDVIAYTLPGDDNIIRLHGRKYKYMGVADIAGNLTHEWIHLMGFYHDSAADSRSVPYAVGDIMTELAKKFIAQGFLD